MKRLLTPGRAASPPASSCSPRVLALMIFPSDQYIFLPDAAHPVAPLVTFKGSRNPTKGGVFFVDVFERKATLLERLFGGLHDGADLYPADAVNPPGVGEQPAAADRPAGHAPVAGDRGCGGSQGRGQAGRAAPDGRARRRRRAGQARGRQARARRRDRRPQRQARATPRQTSSRAWRSSRSAPRPSSRSGAAEQTLVQSIKTVASDDPPRRAVVGVFLEPAIDIHLPFPVRIDAGNVGGPSAGLAFALEVMEELGHDVVHGHKIAATGEIAPDGSVHPIGGIKQKTIGAREAGVDAFLVPAGDNAREARKHAHGLRIIPVESFPQALRALATLGPAA